MKRPEDNLQASCVQWFKLQYPLCLLWATPNAAKRSIREYVALKRTGLVAGVPDLFIAEANGHYHGLFVEMKAGRGEVTEKQQEMIDALRVRGYAVHVCKSLDEFVGVVNQYMEG